MVLSELLCYNHKLLMSRLVDEVKERINVKCWRCQFVINMCNSVKGSILSLFRIRNMKVIHFYPTIDQVRQFIPNQRPNIIKK